MSDVSQGPGWWLASDGKWYSPDLAPGLASPDADSGGCEPVPESDVAPGFAQPEPAPTAPVGTGAPPAAPPFGVPFGGPSGAPGFPPPAGPPGSFAPGYGYPPAVPGYGYVPEPRNNGLAIAAMVCSFFFWMYGIPAILAIVFGFVARSQIRRSNGAQKGGGMALTGIIIGFAGIAIGIVLTIVVVVVVNHCNQNGNCTVTTGY